MRVGIYNRYWTTCGGGERYAGTIVEAFKGKADVDLIGIEPLDLDDLGSRLDLDLAGARFVLWPEASSRLTRPYDLFVNATYGSSLRSEAKRSAYIVLFPHRVPSNVAASFQRLILSLGRRVGSRRVIPVAGCYDVEMSGLCWTSPQAWLRLEPRAFSGRSATIRLRPHAAPTRIVSVTGPIASWSAGLDYLSVTVDRGPRHPIEIHVQAEPFVPKKLGLGNDMRALGVHLDLGPGWTLLRGRLGGTGEGAFSREFLQDYDTLLAISQYTQRWVKRRWGRDSVVVPPPVDTERFRPRASDDKQSMILSVGRFFAPERGHDKKHVEMLYAFRTMCDRGLVPPGWEFHLAGRVHRELPEDVAHFEKVRRLAEGYPVRILADVPYDQLVAEYRAASIFWHAAGWGEDDTRYPERFEHFGITTCEAMSAGCTPVVIAKAGQAEIVTDGVNGHTFATLEELITKTRLLITSFGSSRSAALARSAQVTAERYSKSAFSDAVNDVLLDQVRHRPPWSVTA